VYLSKVEENAIRARWIQLLSQHLRGHRVYVACPYTSKSAKVRQARVAKVTLLSALLFAEGVDVFSPLTHTVPLESVLLSMAQTGRWLNARSWLDLDKTFIRKWAEKMLVLCLPGWENSYGIQRETSWCMDLHIPVWYVDPQEVKVLYHMVLEKGDTACQWAKSIEYRLSK